MCVQDTVLLALKLILNLALWLNSTSVVRPFFWRMNWFELELLFYFECILSLQWARESK